MIWIILGILIGGIIGFQIGFYLKQLLTKISDIYNRDPEPEARVISPLPPGYSDVNNQSAIVTPKTPYEVDLEEQARIRNIS